MIRPKYPYLKFTRGSGAKPSCVELHTYPEEDTSIVYAMKEGGKVLAELRPVNKEEYDRLPLTEENWEIHFIDTESVPVPRRLIDTEGLPLLTKAPRGGRYPWELFELKRVPPKLLKYILDVTKLTHIEKAYKLAAQVQKHKEVRKENFSKYGVFYQKGVDTVIVNVPVNNYGIVLTVNGIYYDIVPRHSKVFADTFNQEETLHFYHFDESQRATLYTYTEEFGRAVVTGEASKAHTTNIMFHPIADKLYQFLIHEIYPAITQNSKGQQSMTDASNTKAGFSGFPVLTTYPRSNNVRLFLPYPEVPVCLTFVPGVEYVVETSTNYISGERDPGNLPVHTIIDDPETVVQLYDSDLGLNLDFRKSVWQNGSATFPIEKLTVGFCRLIERFVGTNVSLPVEDSAVNQSAPDPDANRATEEPVSVPPCEVYWRKDGDFVALRLPYENNPVTLAIDAGVGFIVDTAKIIDRADRSTLECAQVPQVNKYMSVLTTEDERRECQDPRHLLKRFLDVEGTVNIRPIAELPDEVVKAIHVTTGIDVNPKKRGRSSDMEELIALMEERNNSSPFPHLMQTLRRAAEECGCPVCVRNRESSVRNPLGDDMFPGLGKSFFYSKKKPRYHFLRQNPEVSVAYFPGSKSFTLFIRNDTFPVKAVIGFDLNAEVTRWDETQDPVGSYFDKGAAVIVPSDTLFRQLKHGMFNHDAILRTNANGYSVEFSKISFHASIIQRLVDACKGVDTGDLDNVREALVFVNERQ